MASWKNTPSLPALSLALTGAVRYRRSYVPIGTSISHNACPSPLALLSHMELQCERISYPSHHHLLPVALRHVAARLSVCFRSSLPF